MQYGHAPIRYGHLCNPATYAIRPSIMEALNKKYSKPPSPVLILVSVQTKDCWCPEGAEQEARSVYTHAQANVSTPFCTPVDTHVDSHVYTHFPARVCARVHAHVYTHVYTHFHARVCAQVHAHVYTHVPQA